MSESSSESKSNSSPSARNSSGPGESTPKRRQDEIYPIAARRASARKHRPPSFYMNHCYKDCDVKHQKEGPQTKALKQARQLMKEGEYAKAEDVLTKFMASNPQDITHRIYFERAKYRYGVDNCEGSWQDFQKFWEMVKSNPKPKPEKSILADAHYYCWWVALGLDKYKIALKHVKRFLSDEYVMLTAQPCEARTHSVMLSMIYEDDDKNYYIKDLDAPLLEELNSHIDKGLSCGEQKDACKSHELYQFSLRHLKRAFSGNPDATGFTGAMEGFITKHKDVEANLEESEHQGAQYTRRMLEKIINVYRNSAGDSKKSTKLFFYSKNSTLMLSGVESDDSETTPEDGEEVEDVVLVVGDPDVVGGPGGIGDLAIGVLGGAGDPGGVEIADKIIEAMDEDDGGEFKHSMCSKISGIKTDIGAALQRKLTADWEMKAAETDKKAAETDKKAAEQRKQEVLDSIKMYTVNHQKFLADEETLKRKKEERKRKEEELQNDQKELRTDQKQLKMVTKAVSRKRKQVDLSTEELDLLTEEVDLLTEQNNGKRQKLKEDREKLEGM